MRRGQRLGAVVKMGERVRANSAQLGLRSCEFASVKAQKKGLGKGGSWPEIEDLENVQSLAQGKVRRKGENCVGAASPA